MARQHLKYVGIRQVKLNRYKAAVIRFFDFVTILDNPHPRTVAELEYATSEFVNLLYQEDRPLSWASTFLSGMWRLCP